MSGTVIITGGTKGIGAGIARQFHDAGWSVLITARNDNGFAGSLGERARFRAMEAGVATDHAAAVADALNWTGALDAYVNCAGFSGWRAVADINEGFWQTMVATNLSGTLWGCQAAAEAFQRTSRSGTIVNVSSLAGKRGSARNTAYCATKFGVNGITQSLAKELGPAGIRVNAVCPVYVETPGVLEALEDPASPAGGGDVPAYLAEFAAAQAALQRLPRADEVGALCLFLASDAASAVTGQCINVDCGVLPQ